MEELDILEGPRHAEACCLVRLFVLDFPTFKGDGAGTDREIAGNKVKQCCLACPVGPDHRLDGARGNPEADIIDRMQAAESFMHRF